MAKKRIGILTGGGDVPGLNTVIRDVTYRARYEDYEVVGIRRGWGGLIYMDPEGKSDDSEHIINLNHQVVRSIGRTGGTILRTSRTNPTKVTDEPDLFKYRGLKYDQLTDLTGDVLKNLDRLGIDTLIAIGGDDTLSYGQRLHEEGVRVVAVPKTMDNDVPGTDYCIGFSTCVTRTIELTHALRTTAGSHERFLVIEVFGRYAGYTALLPTMAGAADRCVIPEHEFEIEHLAELLAEDRRNHPSKYAVVLVSEGARMKSDDMSFEGSESDQYGHRKLGGIGDRVAARLKDLSPTYNQGRRVNIVNQRLGYLVRCGNPDALDSIVPMAFGNLALGLILSNTSGRLVSVRNGVYDSVPIDVVTGRKKAVDLHKYYNVDRLRPIYKTLIRQPLFVMTSDV